MAEYDGNMTRINGGSPGYWLLVDLPLCKMMDESSVG